MAARTSSSAVVERLERHIGSRAALQARAVAHSPSGCAIFCIAVGAATSGAATARPSSVVPAVRADTSTMPRKWISNRFQADSFAASVVSSQAPER